MQIKREQFINPPIKEAIFVIYFKEAIEAEKLNLFRQTDFVKAVFPNYNPTFTVEVTNKKSVDLKGVKPVFATSHKEEGYTLQGEKGLNKLIQVLPTHISYHNFNRYAGWEVMYAELQNIWSDFCSSIGKIEVSRISVRYINQLLLPLPFKNGFSDYIKLLPQIPEGINPSLNSFFLQIDVPCGKNEMQGIITETLLPNTQSSDKLNFLIDLTVLKAGKFDSESEEIWAWFTQIRDFKNDLFFSCITEEAKKLFN